MLRIKEVLHQERFSSKRNTFFKKKLFSKKYLRFNIVYVTFAKKEEEK